MRSCRNCENATHDGYYHIRLICGLTRKVIVPFSKHLEENKQADAYAQREAKYCSAYTLEGEAR